MNDTTQLLTYLRTIISTGSITAAAKKLFVSQPYLSRYISQNEQKLGYRLLDRQQRPIALTSLGVQFLQGVEQLNNRYNRLLHNLQKMADQDHLRLGINQSMSSIVAPPLLARYQCAHESTHISFTEGISAYLENLLLSGQIDAHLRLKPIFPNNIHYIEVCTIPVYLIINRSSPLFVSGREDILTLPIRAATFNVADYITLDSGSGFMRQLELFFAAEKLTPQVMMNVNYIQTAANMAYQGLGCTLVPKYCVQTSFDAHVCNVLKVPETQLTVDAVVAYLAGSGMKAKVQELISSTDLSQVMQKMSQ